MKPRTSSGKTRRTVIFDPGDGSWYGEDGWETDPKRAKVFRSKRAARDIIAGDWCPDNMAARLRVLPESERWT